MNMTKPAFLAQSPYQSYVYSYPHKTAYRPFDPPIDLADMWRDENKDALFLYFHIPFCEIRCGFCNLFTTVHPEKSLERQYLETLKIQAQETIDALGDATFARMAIGGGTPTYLTPDELNNLFSIASDVMGADLEQIPISIETSPMTATIDRLNVLREHHVDRVSIGVQSFIEREVNQAGRAQKTAKVHQALQNIRHMDFPTLNIDLIYGLPEQTVESWLTSISIALQYHPEELYLYPLYVRPLTGMDKMTLSWDDLRLNLYRVGRDYLLDNGYEQISMRMFRSKSAPQSNAPVYCCQQDGMVGLGCGARSYTRDYHYSSEYAVGRSGILDILRDYSSRTAEDFRQVNYGFALDNTDQKIRYILKSILHESGLHLAMYRTYFGASACEEFPQLAELIELNILTRNDDTISITPKGLEWSDAIGTLFYSEKVTALMEGYNLR